MPIDEPIQLKADDVRREQAKQELSVLMEEYKALRAEIVATLTAAYGVTALTLTAVGVLLASTSFALQADKPVVFGVAPLVFCGLVWTQFRYALAVMNMSNHLIVNVAPSVRRCLNTMTLSAPVASPQPPSFGHVLTWELAGRGANHSTARSMLPIEAARFALPLLAALISWLAYIYFSYSSGKANVADAALVVFVFCFLAYTVWAGWEVRKELADDPLKPVSPLPLPDDDDVPPAP